MIQDLDSSIIVVACGEQIHNDMLIVILFKFLSLSSLIPKSINYFLSQ